MTRTRATARKAGPSFERLIADYLAQHVDDRIDRRVKTGAKDRGDISGIRMTPALRGGRIVAELKNTARTALSAWAAETEIERLNDDAAAGVIIHKRHGVAAPGRQWVSMTLDDWVVLLTGERPTGDCAEGARPFRAEVNRRGL